MTEEQIKHMVSRFLTWKIPATFNPDNGITNVPMYVVDSKIMRRDQSGTNLFDGEQAEEMIRHMLEGLPE
ncbi:hypothetical protein NL532_24100 [Mesorhizobium sp. C120A]|jgi:hypothetical protein|uniref:hypothetical protein n=1 Tax=unclassified Mesorhizobium TaxID=325217 RepID=UPI0003D00B39|nr:MULTISPECIES: hypothetical protein [unclassified Mesorhizobium]ESZ60656.1 hypothetical protein X728_15055 [Mesorhizobium sp. L103C120A0]WJI43692.1 hypothetical protein NL532_24100 [Mesorhizobium sp. C120A]